MAEQRNADGPPLGPADWNQRYIDENTPWDSGEPSLELGHILDEMNVPPSRVLELGCGTGTNAVYLSQRGFDVTAVDVSAAAIEQARARAHQAGVDVTFVEADVCDRPDLGPPYPFIFDRGLYHVVRRDHLARFLDAIEPLAAPGALYLTLTGNANDPVEMEAGPPRVSAEEICHELSTIFDLVQLREFTFDGVIVDGQLFRPLAWSALWRKK